MNSAKECIGLPWNVCRTEIYSGTGLLERIRREGRLQGDYRSYGYRMRDSRAELMFRILRVSLHERAFAFDSLMNRLISLSFARQVHQRFFPGPPTDAFAERVARLIDAVHRDTLDMLWQAHDFASSTSPEDLATARDFAIQMGLEASRRDHGQNLEAIRLWDYGNVRGLTLTRRTPNATAPSFNQVTSFS